VVLRVIGRVLLPILGVGALLIWVAWRWGRLYCGWLCPHFSVVETINACMRRATGRPSLWESRRCRRASRTARRCAMAGHGGW
jgi:polyferredoxin